MTEETIQDAVVVDEQPASTELVPQTPATRLLPNPFTGVAIDLDADSETLARAIRELRDLDEERKQIVKDISHELLQRMDQDASWTLHFPGLDVSGDTPNRKTYKSERLVKVLEALVTEGKISKEAAQAAVEVEVKYKVKKRGVDAIRKLGGEISKRLYGCEVPIPDSTRSVSVKVKEPSPL